MLFLAETVTTRDHNVTKLGTFFYFVNEHRFDPVDHVQGDEVREQIPGRLTVRARANAAPFTELKGKLLERHPSCNRSALTDCDSTSLHRDFAIKSNHTDSPSLQRNLPVQSNRADATSHC